MRAEGEFGCLIRLLWFRFKLEEHAGVAEAELRGGGYDTAVGAQDGRTDRGLIIQRSSQ